MTKQLFWVAFSIVVAFYSIMILRLAVSADGFDSFMHSVFVTIQ